ncbi:MAG: hypothetical protein JWN04_3683 [Myxococcaceae bacterium]|nr:hypothetical protein [Myxococcaceae bacterium]
MGSLLVEGTDADVQGARTELERRGFRVVSKRCIAAPALVVFDAAEWLEPTAKLLTFDHQIHVAEDASEAPDSLTVVVRGEGRCLVEAALGVASRYQRLWPRTNAASDDPVFARVLAAHAALHDRSKPLVRADYEHALDVWQWLVRLEPGASRALQLAALFHDVERLESEATTRVEQHAADYQAFKSAHAAQGAQRTRAILGELLPSELVSRVAWLVERHEQPGDDPELRALNDADALSFFALNSAGFLAYYGAQHTEKKVRYTLSRLSSGLARSALGTLRLEPFIIEALGRAQATSVTAQPRA